ncbi:MAG: hypothetical protein JNK33_03935, partial [Candidatus Doudnabacteria bacterium]|nr:hypothetical protein [Candidatus Doudnabacteria bacterium]
MQVLKKNQFHNSRFVLPALLLWQLVSVYLMATGVWPASVAWLSLGLIVAYILLSPVFSGLLLAVASIPFYIVLPQPYSDTLSMWRPVVAILFLRAFAECAWHFRASLKVPRTVSVSAVKGFIVTLWNKLLVYERLAIVLFGLAVLSLCVARYPVRGASQLLFVLNTFLVYAVVVWAVKSRTQFIKLLTYGAVSTGAIVALGYVQFVATLFSTTYYFWQYWAIRVASLYYGVSLARVLQY